MILTINQDTMLKFCIRHRLTWISFALSTFHTVWVFKLIIMTSRHHRHGNVHFEDGHDLEKGTGRSGTFFRSDKATTFALLSGLANNTI